MQTAMINPVDCSLALLYAKQNKNFYTKRDLKDIINLTLFAASSWFDWITSVDSDNISGATETLYIYVYRILRNCVRT